mmetsp:Transcript_21089/g.81859  ORF Transcript_21089/g.81859 Transcript_21089/m.81859 type:complete len:435 (-) Transcript_21089:1995-3299(-)
MLASDALIDPAPLGVVVDVERLLQMHRDLGAGPHVDGGEGLAVKLVDPIGHVADAPGQDAAHRLVAADAHRAERAVAVGDDGHAAVVRLDQGRRAGARRGDEGLRAQVLLRVAAPLAADAGDAIGIADPAQAAVRGAVCVAARAPAAVLVAVAVLRHRAHRAVVKNERHRANLAAHAGERPVARGRAADHRAGHVGNVDAVGGQVVRADQHLEGVRVVDRAVDGHAPDQRGHRDGAHQRRVRRHRVDRLGRRAHRAAARIRHRAGHVVGRVGKRLLRRPEAGREVQPAAAAALRRRLRIVRLNPARAAGAARGAALGAAETLAIAFLQAEAHRQVGLAALAGETVQAPLQVLQQALGLLAVAGELLAVLLQAAALAVERRLDALVDRAFPRAHAFVLALLVLVVVERRLQLVAQLLDLGHQRRDGIARRVALDA